MRNRRAHTQREGRKSDSVMYHSGPTLPHTSYSIGGDLSSVGQDASTNTDSRMVSIDQSPMERSKSLDYSLLEASGWHYREPLLMNDLTDDDRSVSILKKMQAISSLLKALLCGKLGAFGWFGRVGRLIGFYWATYISFLRLVLFAVLVSSALVHTGAWWWSSSRVVKDIPYGPNRRNFLDLYLPRAPGRGSDGRVSSRNKQRSVSSPRPVNKDEIVKYPVVFMLTGGAWIIGYKVWTAAVCRVLMSEGSHTPCIIVSPDYRNYPFGTLKDMLVDAIRALQWTIAHVADFGGDTSQIYLVGQSAGSHLLSLVLLEAAKVKASKPEFLGLDRSAPSRAGEAADPSLARDPNISLRMNSTESSITSCVSPTNNNGLDSTIKMCGKILASHLTRVRAFISISGVYDVVEIVPSMVRKGLPLKVIMAIMNHRIFTASPLRNMPEDCSAFPHTYLMHGSSDRSVPLKQSMRFARKLRTRGCKKDISLTVMLGATHSDPIVEMPFLGDHCVAQQISNVIQKHSSERTAAVLQQPESQLGSQEPSDQSQKQYLPTPVSAWSKTPGDDSQACYAPFYRLARKVMPF